jgi:hypothetical protein
MYKINTVFNIFGSSFCWLLTYQKAVHIPRPQVKISQIHFLKSKDKSLNLEKSKKSCETVLLHIESNKQSANG